MAKIGFIGRQLDLDIKQGAEFGPHTVTLRNPDLTPVNLTGCTFSAQIRQPQNRGGALIVALEIAMVDALAGKFSFKIPANLTATMPANNGANTAFGRFPWDLRMLDAASRPTFLFYGTANVYDRVTE